MKCIKCGVELTNENFNETRLKTRNYLCNSCQRIYSRDWSRKNKEKCWENRERYKKNFIKKYGLEAWRNRERKICARYRGKHREDARKRTIIWIHKLTEEVINHYGGKCICCRETNILFLTIDHPNNDGAKHRKEIFGKPQGGVAFYYWLKKNGFPEGYQVMCYNCNCGKERNKGICPHKGVLRW